MATVDVTVDTELCQGARQCSFVAPAVFDHGPDGKAVVLDPGGAPIADVLKAAQMCPNLAISLVVDGETLHEGF